MSLNKPTLWKRNNYILLFYGRDETVVATFQSIWEIVDYKHLPHNKTSYNLIYVDITRALRRPDHYTEMLGVPMTVYLEDTN